MASDLILKMAWLAREIVEATSLQNCRVGTLRMEVDPCYDTGCFQSYL
jgi:hypothetical protein